MAEPFTKRQGEYLAFLHLYSLLNKRPPAEADFQAYFGVSAPTVHQMLVSLQNRGLIHKTPGQARSLRLLVAPETLPSLTGSSHESRHNPAAAQGSFVERYPHVAFWVREHGQIELGYDYNTDTCARAIDEGGMTWGGGNSEETVAEWLQALKAGVEELIDELGLA